MKDFVEQPVGRGPLSGAVIERGVILGDYQAV
jgi:hypothetical protein